MYASLSLNKSESEAVFSINFSKLHRFFFLSKDLEDFGAGVTFKLCRGRFKFAPPALVTPGIQITGSFRALAVLGMGT